MLIVYVALMIAGLVGIIVCQKKQKTNPNAQAVAFVFLIVILVGAGGMLHQTGMFGGDPEMDRIMSNEITYAKARSSVLSDYIVQNWKGQSAVIITEPNLDQNKIAKAGLDALQEKLKAGGIEVTAVEALNLPQGTAEEPVPMEVALNAKVYNDIFNKYKNVNTFIIMSQLPIDSKELAKLQCWKFDSKKSRVVVVSGEIVNLKAAISKGLVGAAIGMKTGKDAYDPEKSAPKDVKAAFDTRYILITSKNVNDEKFKDLFAK